MLVRLAWFAPTPDDVALELARRHDVDHYDARNAHDFVWKHFRTPYDLTVFELADSPAHAFVWPYLFHYPGVAILRATSLQEHRTRGLNRQWRRPHLRAERAFGGPDLMRAPLLASRLVVVNDEPAARVLAAEHPDAAVRILPVGVRPASAEPGRELRFRSTTTRADVIEAAAQRARDVGTPIPLTPGLDGLRETDVVIVLEWPPTGAMPVDALRAMGAGLPTIVFETEAVAAWPALDPQTWQPRGYVNSGEPIAISIDPRDEEHSLMRCLRRLSADPALRSRLGDAARDWVREHANAESAAREWEPVLADAIHRPPVLAPADLPPHLVDDGTATAQSVLQEFGVSVDLFNREW